MFDTGDLVRAFQFGSYSAAAVADRNASPTTQVAVMGIQAALLDSPVFAASGQETVRDDHTQLSKVVTESAMESGGPVVLELSDAAVSEIRSVAAEKNSQVEDAVFEDWSAEL